ncbi:MAG: GNAT family N-acetyltransferase [Pricia sp.]|nr:GNAT family N-acetyltransferase [Pricia sp.]
MYPIRIAKRKDLNAIVQLLSEDPLGKKREDYQIPLPNRYYRAFEKIASDPNQELVVVEGAAGEVIGTLQLSFLRYLTYQGGMRAQIEAVRVHNAYRGKGIGRQLFEWAIQRAKEKGAHVVQLTTDKKRPNAISFYKKIGFVASHEGMKLHIK